MATSYRYKFKPGLGTVSELQEALEDIPKEILTKPLKLRIQTDFVGKVIEITITEVNN